MEPGIRVEHYRFGEGTVMEPGPLDGVETIRVYFDKWTPPYPSVMVFAAEDLEIL